MEKAKVTLTGDERGSVVQAVEYLRKVHEINDDGDDDDDDP